MQHREHLLGRRAHGVINQADYSASKAGIIGLTRALALEYASRGMRVNAIAPGMIMTDMLRGVNPDELSALAATIPQATSATCPTSRAPWAACSQLPM